VERNFAQTEVLEVQNPMPSIPCDGTGKIGWSHGSLHKFLPLLASLQNMAKLKHEFRHWISLRRPIRCYKKTLWSDTSGIGIAVTSSITRLSYNVNRSYQRVFSERAVHLNKMLSL